MAKIQLAAEVSKGPLDCHYRTHKPNMIISAKLVTMSLNMLKYTCLCVILKLHRLQKNIFFPGKIFLYIHLALFKYGDNMTSKNLHVLHELLAGASKKKSSKRLNTISSND